jgi:hypothetical protein
MSGWLDVKREQVKHVFSWTGTPLSVSFVFQGFFKK